MTKATSVPAGSNANGKGNVNTNEAYHEKQLSAREYYANTAYSSEMWKQQPHNKKHFFSGMFELAVNDIRNVIPKDYIDDTYEILHAEMDPDEAHIPFSFDHEKICTVKGTREFFAIICTLGGYITLIGGGVFIIGGLLLMLLVMNNPERLENMQEFICYFGLLPAFIGGLMIGITKLPRSIGLVIFGSGVRDFEFNRRTGMLTRWKYIPLTGIKRRTISKPFSEFVPYVYQLRTGAGTGAGWNMIMMHKDSRRLSFGTSGLLNPISHGDAMAFWDFIQCYMDISRPLPDTPILEIHRQKDPVTREHDKETGRPERYWRDMTHDEIQVKAMEMRQRIERLAKGEE
ncbi:hypothetical protein [uncultured Shewanella sp.]|uniref:hypothetical protein n=1 Tax=uncultured Shewanella sp. TaxID=173975 RepID=UPI00262561BA|nr:hypothetical protein [uncultured Shewanella sp.]